ncbi:Lrp/AsnC family transcriptional regulator [Halospeciosus flavus]|uniref:Lrp/AsnC family transcriptional regulator n=1 Tax=Halospeciosus flavus TaxID=3032283 RepID=A0ABD5Z404_9EURY|nr:Lrp/AsnC family transcriptional regulator [Halospeciosus flavus]
MDETRRELLELLRENARYEVADLARQLGVDAETVEEHLAALERAGVLRGYTAVVDWRNVDEERVRASVELNVELDRETGYEDIARRIAKYPEVRELRLVSGDYDFAIEVEGESMNEVSQFISEQIAPIPEITQTVTHYVMETYKEAGIDFERADEDDRLTYSP